MRAQAGGLKQRLVPRLGISREPFTDSSNSVWSGLIAQINPRRKAALGILNTGNSLSKPHYSVPQADWFHIFIKEVNLSTSTQTKKCIHKRGNTCMSVYHEHLALFCVQHILFICTSQCISVQHTVYLYHIQHIYTTYWKSLQHTVHLCSIRYICTTYCKSAKHTVNLCSIR